MNKEELLKRLGIENSSVEKQNEILQNLANAVSTRIMVKLSEQLTDEDLDQISKMIDNNQDMEVERFINSKIPNYEEFKNKIEADMIEEVINNKSSIMQNIDAISSEKLSLS
jgi:hypothetical protein